MDQGGLAEGIEQLPTLALIIVGVILLIGRNAAISAQQLRRKQMVSYCTDTEKFLLLVNSFPLLYALIGIFGLSLGDGPLSSCVAFIRSLCVFASFAVAVCCFCKEESDALLILELLALAIESVIGAEVLIIVAVLDGAVIALLGFRFQYDWADLFPHILIALIAATTSVVALAHPQPNFVMSFYIIVIPTMLYEVIRLVSSIRTLDNFFG